MPEGGRNPRIDRTCAAPGCCAPRNLRLTLTLLALLPALAWLLETFRFRRTYLALGRLSGGPRARRARLTPAQLVATVVHINRHVLPFQSRCLLESLALWFLLRRRGFDADLRIGARTILGPFESHAWVELEGSVLNDTDDVRAIYEAFDLRAIAPAYRAP